MVFLWWWWCFCGGVFGGGAAFFAVVWLCFLWCGGGVFVAWSAVAPFFSIFQRQIEKFYTF